MGAHFVEVNLGLQRVVTLEYSPTALLTAPIEVAEAAIAQEEASFMSNRFGPQVLEDISSLLLIDDGTYRENLTDYFRSKHFGEVVCTYVADGRADWKFSLRCDECHGSGTTYTVSNKRVPCPDCDEGGITAEAYFETDLDGRFTKWGNDGCLGAVMNYGHGSDAIRISAMPEDKALAMVAGWWS